MVLIRKNGRGDWIRTSDFYVPNVALYQAEPRPDRGRKSGGNVADWTGIASSKTEDGVLLAKIAVLP
jgi:hypothetical protein